MKAAASTRGLAIAIGIGLVVLCSAFLPSPLQLFDAFESETNVVVPRPPVLKLAEPKPVTAFADIVARPLFNPGRKADPEDGAPVPEAGEPYDGGAGDLSRFRLVGIVTDSATQRAIVERDGAPTLRLAPGDTIDGWRVKKIDRLGVVATKDSKSVRIVIPKSRSATANP